MDCPPDIAWYLTIERTEHDDGLVLAVWGRLGRAGSVDLARALGEAIDQGRTKIVLNLSGVDYISSAALRALESAADRLHVVAGTLVLRGAQGPVKLALDLAGSLGHVVTAAER